MDEYLKERIVDQIAEVAALTVKMDSVEKRMDTLNTRVDGVATKIDKVELHVIAVEQKLDKLLIRAGALAAGFTFAIVSIFKGLEFFFKYMSAKFGG